MSRPTAVDWVVALIWAVVLLGSITIVGAVFGYVAWVLIR